MPGQTPTTRSMAGDSVALLARVVIGVIFAVHGWQKITSGVAGTGQMFTGMGVPMPEVAAVVAMVIEFGGGIALLLGFALPVTGVLLAAQMAAAIYFAHLGAPLTGEGGMELPMGLGVAALALGFTGGGLAVDRFLPWGRRANATAPEPA